MLVYWRRIPQIRLYSNRFPPNKYANARFFVTRDHLIAAIEAEFKGERISAGILAEERLDQKVRELVALKQHVNQASGAELMLAKKAFNEQRKIALSLRFELTVQREASGFRLDSSLLDARYLIPAEIM